VSRLHIILPALDEAPNVPPLLDSLRALGSEPHVLLVDDGSTDGTAEVARAHAGDLALTVISHERPRGPGCAFRSGFEHLSGQLVADDLVLTMEADNTSRVELLAAMGRRLEEGYDAVLASPYMYGGGIVETTPGRVMLSHLANAFVKEFLGIHGILTVSSFFRLRTGAAVKRLQSRYGPGVIECAGFECMVEELLKMTYLDMGIAEVPMVLDSSRRAGASKMRIVRTGRGYLGLFRRKGAWARAA
jgi:glycosyltransferase involved in cell wall biosynthesis